MTLMARVRGATGWVVDASNHPRMSSASHTDLHHIPSHAPSDPFERFCMHFSTWVGWT